MADPLRSNVAPAVEQHAAAKRPPSGKTADSRRPKVQLHHRFGAAYLVLAALVGAAVGLFVVFVGHQSSSTPTPRGQAWSTFHPERSGELAAKEIARHVSPQYRLANGRQLLEAVAERPQYQNVEMNFNLIRPSDAQSQRDLALLPIGNGIMYILCGTGQNCSIEGTPSPRRLLLVRQEAIELALLTFKNDSAVQTVLSLLPPTIGNQGQTTTSAVIFRRIDLLNDLNRPLAASVPGKPPFTPNKLTQSAADRIREISDPAFYAYQARTAADGTPYLELDPIG